MLLPRIPEIAQRNRNFTVLLVRGGVLENFKSVIQESEKETVFGGKDQGLHLGSATFYVCVLGIKVICI